MMRSAFLSLIFWCSTSVNSVCFLFWLMFENWLHAQTICFQSWHPVPHLISVYMAGTRQVSKSGTVRMIEISGYAFSSERRHCSCHWGKQDFTLHRPQMLQRPEVGQLLVCMSCHAMRAPLWKVNWASRWFMYVCSGGGYRLSERSPAGFSCHPLPDVWWSLFYCHPPHCVFVFHCNVADAHCLLPFPHMVNMHCH